MLLMTSEPVNPTEEALYEFKHGMGVFTQKMPEIAGPYNDFAKACFKEGQITQKGKQLIALGISLYAQDEYCIIYHLKGCIDNGASETEIMEAVGVTGAFGGGAALSQGVTLVQEALDDLLR